MPKEQQPHHHPKDPTKEPSLRLVAWEITRNCNLSCVHCRASATMGPYEGELDTQAGFKLLDQIKEVGDPIIILTGGEPLLRHDIFDIARYGTDLGLCLFEENMLCAVAEIRDGSYNIKGVYKAFGPRISLALIALSDSKIPLC